MTLGLLPTLAEQILDGMDVESLTRELQSRSRSAGSPLPPAASAPPPDPPVSEPTGDGDHVETSSTPGNGGSELAGSTPSLLSYPTPQTGSADASTSGVSSSMMASVDMAKSTQSWVHDFSSQNDPNHSAPSSTSAATASEDLSAVSSRTFCLKRSSTDASVVHNVLIRQFSLHIHFSNEG
jgi:peroxin-3